MIPKIIHIIWLDELTPQLRKRLDGWVENNLGWQIKLWSYEDVVGNSWVNAKKLEWLLRRDLAGAANVMKWEILYNEGGIVVDLDLVSQRELPDSLLEYDIFACAINELEAPGKLSVDCVGSEIANPFIGQMILDISSAAMHASQSVSSQVGEEYFNTSWRKYSYSNLTVLPSHSFIARHPKGGSYTGKAPVYAYKKWGAALGAYDQKFDEELRCYRPGITQEPIRVTIAIPVWNSEKFIGECLRSALSQDYPDLEILIVDDGSTDNSAQIIRDFDDPRIRYIRQDNIGIAATRNRLLQEASGHYVVWLDSDDILLSNVVSAYVDLATIWPEVAVFNGGLLRFDSDTGAIIEETHGRNFFGEPHLFSKLVIGNFLPNPGSMIKKSVALALGGYDESLRNASDYDYWLRVAAASLPIRHVGRIVCKYRWHQDNVSGKTVQLHHSELSILHKMIRSYGIRELCSDLDWSDLPNAEWQATQRIHDLLVNKGDLKNADIVSTHLNRLKHGVFN